MSGRLHDAADELARYRAKRQPPEREQPDLWSVVSAAVESVADHAGQVWRQEALEAVYETAKRLAYFTVMNLDGLIPATLDKRAVGWVLREGAKRGWYEADGYETGDRTRHGRPVVRWRSLIYRGDAA
jgi:hypothetical protein